MTDIVERLRIVAGDLPPQHHVPLAQEAADEIEAMRITIEGYRMTLAEQDAEIERLHQQVISLTAALDIATRTLEVDACEIERLRAELEEERAKPKVGSIRHVERQPLVLPDD